MTDCGDSSLTPTSSGLASTIPLLCYLLLKEMTIYLFGYNFENIFQFINTSWGMQKQKLEYTLFEAMTVPSRDRSSKHYQHKDSKYFL